MVLSSSTKARSAASLANQNTGGGVKKAGIPRAANVAMRIAFQERGLPQPMSVMMLPLSSTTNASRGIGWRFFEK
jgi:hypothetical protein